MKIHSLLIFCWLLNLETACSQGKSPTENSPLFLDSSRIEKLIKIPKPLGWTSDYAEVFTKEQVRSLDFLLSDFERKTSIEMAILTTNADLVDSLEMDKFSLHIMNTWGVGKPDKKNGILLVIATDSRRMRIQNGKGIEGRLTDSVTKNIIETIFIPYFKEGKFYEGTYSGIKTIQQKIEK